MSDQLLRELEDSDWPALLELANAAVAHVESAGTQEEWHTNRRGFDQSTGAQHQMVLERAGRLAGYAAVESNLAGQVRLFLVTRSEDLETVGEVLYQYSLAQLRELGFERVVFTEYGADQPLLAFARKRGFREVSRFSLPDGVEVVTLQKRLDVAEA